MRLSLFRAEPRRRAAPLFAADRRRGAPRRLVPRGRACPTRSTAALRSCHAACAGRVRLERGGDEARALGAAAGRALHRRHGRADARGRLRRPVAGQAGAEDGRIAGRPGRRWRGAVERSSRGMRRRGPACIATAARRGGDKPASQPPAAGGERLQRRRGCGHAGRDDRMNEISAIACPRPDPRRRANRPGRRATRNARRSPAAGPGVARPAGGPCRAGPATATRCARRGRIKAALAQSCVVSGEPVPARVDEPFELDFLPEPEGAARRGGGASAPTSSTWCSTTAPRSSSARPSPTRWRWPRPLSARPGRRRGAEGRRRAERGAKPDRSRRWRS